MISDNQRRARVFKAFCDEHRVAILDLLKDGERCACELQDSLDIGQSTLSHHMRILCDAGIVTPRRSGKWTYYSLNKTGSLRALIMLKDVLHLGK